MEVVSGKANLTRVTLANTAVTDLSALESFEASPHELFLYDSDLADMGTLVQSLSAANWCNVYGPSETDTEAYPARYDEFDPE